MNNTMICPNHDECGCDCWLCVACLRRVSELVDGDVCPRCAPDWYAKHYAGEEWPDAVKAVCAVQS